MLDLEYMHMVNLIKTAAIEDADKTGLEETSEEQTLDPVSPESLFDVEELTSGIAEKVSQEAGKELKVAVLDTELQDIMKKVFEAFGKRTDIEAGAAPDINTLIESISGQAQIKRAVIANQISDILNAAGVEYDEAKLVLYTASSIASTKKKIKEYFKELVKGKITLPEDKKEKIYALLMEAQALGSLEAKTIAKAKSINSKIEKIKKSRAEKKKAEPEKEKTEAQQIYDMMSYMNGAIPIGDDEDVSPSFSHTSTPVTQGSAIATTQEKGRFFANIKALKKLKELENNLLKAKTPKEREIAAKRLNEFMAKRVEESLEDKRTSGLTGEIEQYVSRSEVGAGAMPTIESEGFATDDLMSKIQTLMVNKKAWEAAKTQQDIEAITSKPSEPIEFLKAIEDPEKRQEIERSAETITLSSKMLLEEKGIPQREQKEIRNRMQKASRTLSSLVFEQAKKMVESAYDFDREKYENRNTEDYIPIVFAAPIKPIIVEEPDAAENLEEVALEDKTPEAEPPATSEIVNEEEKVTDEAVADMEEADKNKVLTVNRIALRAGRYYENIFIALTAKTKPIEEISKSREEKAKTQAAITLDSANYFSSKSPNEVIDTIKKIILLGPNSYKEGETPEGSFLAGLYDIYAGQFEALLTKSKAYSPVGGATKEKGKEYKEMVERKEEAGFLHPTNVSSISPEETRASVQQLTLNGIMSSGTQARNQFRVFFLDESKKKFKIATNIIDPKYANVKPEQNKELAEKNKQNRLKTLSSVKAKLLKMTPEQREAYVDLLSLNANLGNPTEKPQISEKTDETGNVVGFDLPDDVKRKLFSLSGIFQVRENTELKQLESDSEPQEVIVRTIENVSFSGDDNKTLMHQMNPMAENLSVYSDNKSSWDKSPEEEAEEAVTAAYFEAIMSLRKFS